MTTRTSTRVRLVEAGEIVTIVPTGADGTPGCCWIDLRENPDQIDLMDELRGRPALREQVELLSAPESPFITIACAAATTRLFQPGGPPAWRTSSSVQLAFADAECCDLDRYTSLARALLDGLGGDPNATRWGRLVELQPYPVVFPPAGRLTWSLTIRTSAYGLDSGTSAHEWNLCILTQTAAIRSWTWLQGLGGIGGFDFMSRQDALGSSPRTPRRKRKGTDRLQDDAREHALRAGTPTDPSECLLPGAP